MRRALSWATLGVLVLVAAEGTARLAELVLPPPDPTITDGAFSPAGDELPPGFEWMTSEVLHPFFGYAQDRVPDEANRHGVDPHSRPWVGRRPDVVHIALVGGSVANNAAAEIASAFNTAHRERRTRDEVRLVRLSYPGFKQPQQLNVISWLLGLGAHYDVVVNIDGYNEVALSIGENYGSGVYPYFPRRWDQRVSRVPNVDRLREIGRITYFRDWQRSLSSDESPLLQSSAAARLAARSLAVIAESQVALGRARLRTLPIRSDFESKGPFREFKSEAVLRRSTVDHWARTSRLLDHLVRGQGGEYHHVLQPNQYLEGSKRLTDEEMETAYEADDGQAKIAAAAYPLLRKKGEALSAAGLLFHDATQIYNGLDDTIYSDICCHVNDKGNDILARFVVDRVLATTSVPGLQPEPGDR